VDWCVPWPRSSFSVLASDRHRNRGMRLTMYLFSFFAGFGYELRVDMDTLVPEKFSICFMCRRNSPR
jgi:hypothetical protein